MNIKFYIELGETFSQTYTMIKEAKGTRQWNVLQCTNGFGILRRADSRWRMTQRRKQQQLEMMRSSHVREVI
jgi:hypothetical protein